MLPPSPPPFSAREGKRDGPPKRLERGCTRATCPDDDCAALGRRPLKAAFLPQTAKTWLYEGGLRADRRRRPRPESQPEATKRANFGAEHNLIHPCSLDSVASLLRS
ncbi:hypothetical protein CDD83_3225 [Cordyceps sp. RAO-2017]|nr:hypothetical protein CDD83_3225 [Cordyceps sp. RAO-2017]